MTWRTEAIAARADADNLAATLERYEHIIREHGDPFELGDAVGAIVAHEYAVAARRRRPRSLNRKDSA